MASNLRVDSIVPATGSSVSIGTATGGVNIPGVLTYEDVTNVDSVGVITARSGIRIGATGANTLITGNGTGIGIGITTPTEELHIRAATPVIRLEDGDNARQSQIVGSDGNLRLDADNDNAIADTNIAFRTDGGERLRIASSGQIGIAGANYGTAGQVLTSQGSGSSVQWASPSNPTLPHAFVFMDSQYFTSSTTLLEFNNATTGDRSSGVTITRGGSERFTPTVAGTYYVNGTLHYNHGGGTYTPNLYLYRNGSSYIYTRGIVNYNGGHYDSLNVQAMMTFNGSSDYVDMRAHHNGGGNATMNANSSFTMFRVGA